MICILLIYKLTVKVLCLVNVAFWNRYRGLHRVKIGQVSFKFSLDSFDRAICENHFFSMDGETKQITIFI